MIIDKDPNGLNPHDKGAKLDQDKIQPHLIFEGFAAALEAVAAVGTYGAKKYSPDGWKYVDNGIVRYTNALERHLLEEFKGNPVDSETGLLHAAHSAWNALARLQLMLVDKKEEVNEASLLNSMSIKEIIHALQGRVTLSPREQVILDKIEDYINKYERPDATAKRS